MTGEGARLHGGRWSSEGVPVIYASGSLALTVLEYLVHTPAHRLPKDLVAFKIEAPDDQRPEELQPLPDEWNATDAPAACQEAGDHWVLSKRSLLLSVPSVVVSLELNYLINPLHPGMADVRLIEKHSFQFDPRFLASAPAPKPSRSGGAKGGGKGAASGRGTKGGGKAASGRSARYDPTESPLFKTRHGAKQGGAARGRTGGAAGSGGARSGGAKGRPRKGGAKGSSKA